MKYEVRSRAAVSYGLSATSVQPEGRIVGVVGGGGANGSSQAIFYGILAVGLAKLKLRDYTLVIES
jgi:hypothetical protein